MNKSLNIADKALLVRNYLTRTNDYIENKIDSTLSPVPPFRGNGQIKLVVIGQDPTIRNTKRRERISCTLNLDKKGALKTYIENICKGLGITLDNVYATNVFKYFYTVPPADTPHVLAAHLQPNLALLKEELSQYPDCPIITLGEPVLKLLTDKKHKVRDYWKYKKNDFHHISASDNLLGRPIYPFPHQPSLRKELYKTNLTHYLAYMAKK